MKAVRFKCPYYEVCGRKKDLHLSENVFSFDKNKLKLVPDYLNDDNFNICYNDDNFRLFIPDLYCTVKKDIDSENLYFSINNDFTENSKRLNEVFGVIKDLFNEKSNGELMYKDCKIWLTASEYDCQIGHSYHVKDLYIALDSVVGTEVPFLKLFKLDCFMIDSSIFLCSKCDTFSL